MQAEITIDFRAEVTQLGELMQFHGQAPEAARLPLANAIGAMAGLIFKKASLQRELLDKTMIPGPLSPEKLTQIKDVGSNA